MRASRLLALLLQLQQRGTVTADDLAESLEVSTRTILRDVEALSEAGVPVYAQRGAGGGIRLVDGFRTDLTGLTHDEATSLFLVGSPAVAARLGLGAEARDARSKLLNALSGSQANRASALDTWFVHDTDPWAPAQVSEADLRRLTRAVRQRRAVELITGSQASIAVRPLGLVLKAGSWWLAHVWKDTCGFLCVDAVASVRILNELFTPPDTFDLSAQWRTFVVECTDAARPA